MRTAQHAPHHVDWETARELAHAAATERAEVAVLPITEAVGHTLAHDVFASSALPRDARSAMDGWAVANIAGPWRLGEPILAGDAPSSVAAGVARPIATGAAVPDGAVAVIRSEHGDVVRPDTAMLQLNALATGTRAGDHIRPAGEEARRGDPLLRAGTVLNAPRIALAAVAGLDELAVRVPVAVECVLLGDEIRRAGVPEPGAVRDALGPVLPGILAAMGLAPGRMRWAADDPDATLAALAATTAPFVITTGGSSRGPADFVRAALTTLGARLLIDGVAMRPGHPVMLARLPGDRMLLCLPGNPLAAMLCLAGLGVPIADGLLGRAPRALGALTLTVDAPNPARATRLLAFAGGIPVPWQGSGMLRGLASADAVAVIPPGGSVAGETVPSVPLPW